jgi:cytochrome c oxidase subunit 3
VTVSTEALEAQGHEEELISGHDVKRGGMDPALLGMMLFISSEVMFFAALFAAYFNAAATLPVFPPRNGEGHLILDPFHFPFLPIIMTIVLLTSSVTMQWATGRIRKGDRTGLNRAIAVTLGLGVIFMFMWAYDYYTLLTQEDFGINSGIYGTLFYTLTGFHGAHVFGGIIGLAVILSRGRGQFSQKHHVAVEAVHYYWHFVDVVWILLVSVIYFLPLLEGGAA